jgi:hypothetical protein
MMTRMIWRNADAGHGHVLVHRRRRSSITLIRHISGRMHAAILKMRRHAVVLRRSVGIVVLIHGIHLLHLLLVLVLRMILWHVLGMSSSSRTSSGRSCHVDVGHAASSLYILPSRQMMAVTHPAGLGFIARIQVSPNGDAPVSKCILDTATLPSKKAQYLESMANRCFRAEGMGRFGDRDTARCSRSKKNKRFGNERKRRVTRSAPRLR